MSKKIILVIAALIVLVISCSLLLTGCPWQQASLYGIKVVGDSNGGAFAVYENELGGLIYAQKISPDGEAMWGEQGVLLGSSNSKAYSFFNFEIISDGSGGAIVAWPEYPEKLHPSSYLARIDAEGNTVWQRGFVYFNQMISDSSGGAIIAFDYNIGGADITGNDQKDLLLVRVDAKGDYPWGLQGVIVPRGKYQDNTLQMASDGSGGIIVVWEELQYPPEAKPGEAISTGRIFTQKVTSQGELVWGDGVLLYTTPENTYAESPQVISDGYDGALVIWQQMYSGRIEGASPEAQMMDIFVQKVDADGNVLWQESGLPLEINKNAGNAFPTQPLAVSDGSAGVIIIWRDSRDKTGIYAQKVDFNGTVSWQAGGIQVSSTSLNPRPQIISGGFGEALMAYSFQEDWKTLNVQKLDGNGQTVWSGNGVSVTEDGFAGYSISSDGQGGLILAWGVGKGVFSSEKAYIQRVSADGKLLWNGDGVRLNP